MTMSEIVETHYHRYPVGPLVLSTLPLSCRSNKPLELRIAVARKAFSGKQAERRARFLAKIGTPPSFEAIFLPATPPESPALFHFTLPSPGMASPISLFESSSVQQDPQTSSCRLEQVRFRTHMPSLEEISSHFRLTATSSSNRPSIALPKFLSDRKPNGCSASHFPVNHVCHARGISPRLGTGRISQACQNRHREQLTEANLQAFERDGWITSTFQHQAAVA